MELDLLLPPPELLQTDAPKIHAELDRVGVNCDRYWSLIESLAVQWFPTAVTAIAPSEVATKKRGRRKK
jgi:hypothetical protein